MMMLQIPIRRTAALILAAAMTTLLLPGIAVAHAELETTVPADKSTVTEPVAEVSGIYSEAMTADGSSLVVKDANGATVASGTMDPEDTTRMIATPATALGSGAYTVESTVVSTDGHIDHATWTFTVAVVVTPSPPAVASADATVAPTAPATGLASIPPTPVPSASGSTTGSSSDVLLPIIVALIVLGAGAAYLLTRRNRPPDPS